MALPESWGFWIFLCGVSIVGISILGFIGATHARRLKTLLDPHHRRHHVSNSSIANETFTVSGSPIVDAHVHVEDNTQIAKSSEVKARKDRRAPVDAAQSAGLSSPRDERVREESPTDLDPGSSVAVQKLLQRFEDLSARLQQHTNQQERDSTKRRSRGSSDNGGKPPTRGLWRETPAATKRRFDLLCREVQASRARLDALKGNHRTRYASVPGYAAPGLPLSEVTSRSGASPSFCDVGIGGVFGSCDVAAGELPCDSSWSDRPDAEANLATIRDNNKILLDLNSSLDQMLSSWGVLPAQSRAESERLSSLPKNASSSPAATSAKTHTTYRPSPLSTKSPTSSSSSGTRTGGSKSKRRSSNGSGSSPINRSAQQHSAYSVGSGRGGNRRRSGRDVLPTTCTSTSTTATATSKFRMPSQPCPFAPVINTTQGPAFYGEPCRVSGFYPGASPPSPPREATRASNNSVSGGDRCFPPPLPLPRPGGSILQEARAYAPAQHLAVLRALLDGDEGTGDEDRIKDEIVLSSDTDDSDSEEPSAPRGSRVQLKDKQHHSAKVPGASNGLYDGGVHGYKPGYSALFA